MTEVEWFACEDPDPMLEFVKSAATNRKVRLFGVACCRRIWDLMSNKKCKSAVEAAERYSDGLCTDERLRAASAQVKVGMLALRSECAEYAATAAVHVSSQNDFTHSAEAAAVAHGVRISLDDWAEEKRIEQGQQAVLIRDIFGDPFRSATFNPVWRTSDVMLLAQGIYAGRAFDRMPILADALQDAGCDNDNILDHCRDAKQPHVRGCWVVDLVLGKD